MEKTTERPRRHAPSGRWRLGLALTAITVLLWSTVPIALSLLLEKMDAITITWFRFLVGVGVLGVALKLQGRLGELRQLTNGRRLWLVGIAGICLVGNFVVYLYALHFIPPGASQIVMQLAPLFVLLGGVVLFRESFQAVQWCGLCLLLVGLGLFFGHRLSDFTGKLTDYSFGAVLILGSALAWAAYALVQKQLLSVCSSMSIMLVFYAIGVVLLWPFNTASLILDLSVLQYVVLAYSSANTLIGYGCFAEALQHWEASRVSTVVCVTPLLTLGLSYPAHLVWPDHILPEELPPIGIVGAVLVVAGSMAAALGGQAKSKAL